jgi:cell division transport system permease protein
VIISIDNTIRLAMFSNRFLIKTMQMVGATRNFITRPFDRRALINGCISGVLATIGILLVKSFAEAQLPALKTLHNNNLFIVLLIIMIFMGMMITFLSTHRSVIKYLKTPIDDLY